MINWKRRALELAEVVDRHRKDRMHSDMKLGWEMAQELSERGKREEKTQKKFLEYWNCSDKKKKVRLYDEYLALEENLGDKHG